MALTFRLGGRHHRDPLDIPERQVTVLTLVRSSNYKLLAVPARLALANWGGPHRLAVHASRKRLALFPLSKVVADVVPEDQPQQWPKEAHLDREEKDDEYPEGVGHNGLAQNTTRLHREQGY